MDRKNHKNYSKSSLLGNHLRPSSLWEVKLIHCNLVYHSRCCHKTKGARDKARCPKRTVAPSKRRSFTPRWQPFLLFQRVDQSQQQLHAGVAPRYENLERRRRVAPRQQTGVGVLGQDDTISFFGFSSRAESNDTASFSACFGVGPSHATTVGISAAADSNPNRKNIATLEERICDLSCSISSLEVLCVCGARRTKDKSGK